MGDQTKVKLPPLEELESILESCEEAYKNAAPLKLSSVDIGILIDGLRWMTKFVSERRIYHRKHNIRKTVFANLMKERLAADEKAVVEEQVDEKLLERIESVEAPEGNDEAA